MLKPRTLFDKLWDAHCVLAETADAPAILYIDLHLLNEVTSPQAFSQLQERNLQVRRPDLTMATIDHSTPTRFPDEGGRRAYASIAAETQIATMGVNARLHGIPFYGWDDERRGIVHVIAPELGATRPGMTIVCGDSHTSTHGAFGALAFGIGTSEVAAVLATQSLTQYKPKTMRVVVEGELSPHVTAKDVALAIGARLGTGGGAGHVIEYAGSGIETLSMEGRMTVCNMTIEVGARAGMIAPDEKTLAWLSGRPQVPVGTEWSEAAQAWLSLMTDCGATFDREVTIDASSISPMVTWGITPDTGISVDGTVPMAQGSDARRALDYMGFKSGAPIAGQPVDMVFIGSCTNARLPDLRAAAAILRGRHIAKGTTLLVVPGSEQVRAAAEAEGLDAVFRDAGGEWRLAGCSMCLGMNGDNPEPGSLVVSTSNRNFIGRQGPGVRSVLASPATAAACAIAGAIADPRSYEVPSDD